MTVNLGFFQACPCIEGKLIFHSTSQLGLVVSCPRLRERLDYMSRAARRAPPASPAPFNMDEVEIVRRKVAPPSGPPPAGMTAFTAPRKVSERSNKSERDRSRSSSRSRSPHSYRGRRSRTPSPEYSRGRRHSRSRSRSSSDSRGRGRSPRERYSRSPSPDDNRGHRGERMAYGRKHPEYLEDDEQKDLEDHHRLHSEPFAAAKHEKSDSVKAYLSKLPDTKDEKAAASTTDKEFIFNFNTLMKTTYRELRAFILSPPPANTVVRCYIERNVSGSNMFNPVYSLCADLDDGTGRELICCRKVSSRSAHYVFSLKADDLYRKRDQRSRLYLGKLRATSSKEYVLYDSGQCDVPEGAGSDVIERDRSETGSDLAWKAVEDSLYRSQLAVINFNSKKRPCAPEERGMEVCIPHPSLVVAPATVAEGTTSKKILLDIKLPFERLREEGKQNDLYRHKLLVFHERVSR